MIYDVAIIGAGVHGAAAAFHLATMGVRTVVVERDAPAQGPTGRSSAVCRAYYTNPFLARVARESLQFFKRFDQETNGGDAGFCPTGALFLHPESDLEQLRQATTYLNSIGTRTELLDREQLAARFPAVSLAGVGYGSWEQDAGYADPAGTTTGLIGRAVELGTTLLNRTTVTAIHSSSSGVVVACDTGEEVRADRLLIAAGPWTGPLAAQVGASLPLTVERHFVATFRWGGSPPLPFALADVVGEYYLRPEGQDQFLMGPLVPEPQVDPDTFDSHLAQGESLGLITRAVKRVPQLVEAQPTGGWASLYDVSPDWQPVIGQIADRVFVDAGTSGHGFKLAPALGRHVAGLVMAQVIDPDISQFSPTRFDDGPGLGAGWGSARILG
ncbi:MAG: NAD(P)/FAD-dependent oxidoreductase [Euzebya sp.]